MKRILALAFASLLAMSVPAQAARYLQFSFTGRGTFTVTVDTLTMPQNQTYTFSGYVGGPYDINFSYYSYALSLRATRVLPTDCYCIDIYQTIYAVANYINNPFDTSPSQFSYVSLPPGSYADWSEDVQFYDSHIGTFAEYVTDFPITDFRLTGSDDTIGPLGVTYTWLPPYLPEPSAWAMMLGGFSVVGALVRRKRRREKETVLA